MTNPKTHRTLLTKSGVQTIPRDQNGVKFEDYFMNASLPRDPRHSAVYATEVGPVLGDPEPVPWSAEHDVRQLEAVAKVKAAIETEGRYVPTLRAEVNALSRETGIPADDVRARIIGEFTSVHGRDIKTYLEETRAAKGLSNDPPQRGYERGGMSQDPEL